VAVMVSSARGCAGIRTQETFDLASPSAGTRQPFVDSH
jgi:hypothetical protein